MSEWHVFIHSRNIGYIGTVVEDTEELARLAAISKYGIPDDEFNPFISRDQGPRGILSTDDFDVRKI